MLGYSAAHLLAPAMNGHRVNDRDWGTRMSARTVLALLLLGATAAAHADDRKHALEQKAVATPAHPYAGFWKPGDCSVDFGLAITPAGAPGSYSVSFCGPGGCFEPGTYRPNTPLAGDRAYRIIDANTIDVAGAGGFERYVRCPGRVPTAPAASAAATGDAAPPLPAQRGRRATTSDASSTAAIA
jgi:hypothetical protein